MFNGLCIAFVILLIPLVVEANDSSAPMAQSDTSQVFELGRVFEIVVTAQAIPFPETAMVDTKSMKQHNRETVADAGDLLSGVHLTRVGNRNEQTLTVRGFDMRQVPVLMDGIPVYVPFDGYVDLGRFTTFDLAELRVAKGFSSVLYGPNALGGAVNLVSRRPTGKHEGEVGVGMAEASSGLQTHFNLGSNQNHWFVQAGGSFRHRDAYPLSADFATNPVEDGGVRENSYFSDRKLSMKLGFTPNQEDEYVFGVVDQRGEKGLPPYVGQDPNARIRYWQWPYWDKQSFYFISHTGLGSESFVQTRVYYDTFKNALFSYDDDSYTKQDRRYAFKSYYDDYSFGGSAELGHWLADNNKLNLALHLKGDVHRENNEGEPQREFEDRTFSMAGEDIHHFSEDLHLVAGVSFDVRKTLKAENYDGTSISDFPAETATAWNPQVGLFYSLSPGDGLNLTISRKTRMATIKDRYAYRLNQTIPNPNLQPEQATHFEVAYNSSISTSLHLETALFLSNVEDLMQFVRLSDADGGNTSLEQLQNIGKMRNQGAELSISSDIRTNLTVATSYTYLHRENVSDPTIFLTNTPKHKFFTYLDWQLQPAFTVTASVKFESGRTSTSDGLYGTDNFIRADLKIGLKPFSQKGLRLEMGVNNLFDENYAYDEGFPEAGRQWYSNMNYTY